MTRKGEISPTRSELGPEQDTTTILCPVCRRRMPVVESREVTIGVYTTLFRRRRCTVHPGRFTSLELPEHIAKEVMGDD